MPGWLATLRTPGINAPVSQVPSINVTVDHQGIVWCQQVVQQLSCALRDAVVGDGARRSDSGHLHRLHTLRMRLGDAPGAPLTHLDTLALRTLYALPSVPGLCAAEFVSLLASPHVRCSLAACASRLHSLERLYRADATGRAWTVAHALLAGCRFAQTGAVSNPL